MAEPILNGLDVQGNIFPGFNKPHQCFLGFKIINAELARQWLGKIAKDITTAEEVRLFRMLRSLRQRLSGHEPGPEQLSAIWLNVAFSADALGQLSGTNEANQFEDIPFKLGLHERSPLLGDPSDVADVEGSPKNWKVGGSVATTPSVFCIIAGDIKDHLLIEKDRICKLAREPVGVGESALELIYEEWGADLPDGMSGHEHFGFKDGISQPALRGIWSDGTSLSPRLISEDDPRSIQFAKPGQPLIWPGEFLFGHERQDGSVPASSQPAWPAPKWAHNGSFLVFRRLRQDVPRFWNFVELQTKKLNSELGFEELKPVAFASMLVGRWPSGAPIMRAPEDDNRAVAVQPRANHFQYDQPSAPVRYKADSGEADDLDMLAPHDRDGFICPHAAHVRKVNPRDRTTDQGSSTDTLVRRLLRRGIPFGPILDDKTGQTADPENGNRGLMFISYQASIKNQFEFLTTGWMNKMDGPEENPGGHDVLVGQLNAERTCTLRRKVDENEFEVTLGTRLDWIIPTGGAYLFSPSISAIKEVFSSTSATEAADKEAKGRVSQFPSREIDDLKEISGVGEKIEMLLNAGGIFRFDQIAAWDKKDIAEIGTNLESFKGRIDRDDWVGQAKVLQSKKN